MKTKNVSLINKEMLINKHLIDYYKVYKATLQPRKYKYNNIVI